MKLGRQGQSLFVQARAADDERAVIGAPCQGDGFTEAARGLES
jgi:hypothetical protein